MCLHVAAWRERPHVKATAHPSSRVCFTRRAMLQVAVAVQGAAEQLVQRLAASDTTDVPAAMRLFNQAAVGAYAVGACLNSPVLGNSAVAGSSGMLQAAMQASARMAGVGITAAAEAATKLQEADQLGSAAAAVLRVRLPFLVGLLLRGVGRAPFADHSPGGRALAELCQTAWTPSCRS